jgi:hypothetical protein
MLKIISSKDNSIWNLEIDDLALKFLVSNELGNQKYESYQLYFQQIDLNENLTKVFDFDTQQKIVNMIIELNPNPNLNITYTWMKKNIYKSDENEILAFHIIENEYQYTIYIEMKEEV